MPTASAGDEIEFGILTCGCSEYPVVGGIPIIKAAGRINVMQQTRDSVLQIGPDVRDLIALLRAGLNEKALLSLLVIPGRFTGKLLALADCVPTKIKGGIRILADRLWAKEQHKARGFLVDAAGEATARDLLAFYYLGSPQSWLYNHFTYLFGQPRHLAGLSLASLFPASGKPILDLACGFGHYIHYWCTRHPGRRVIGVDRNFFQLYVAKKRIAPGGDFICSEADDRLPFVSHSFSGVFCSDAFHYFLGRWQSVEEMKRLVEAGGSIVLSRFGNSRVEPREGYELSVDGYLRLFDGIPTRMVCEEALLQAYLKKSGPPLDEQPDMTHLTSQKWLYLLASEDRVLFRDYPEFQTWPHAAGRLMLNPLYHEIHKDPDGNITVEFQFPSKWYEFENSSCTQYMPATAAVSKEVLNTIASGTWSEDLESLIRHCVIVGMPERYL